MKKCELCHEKEQNIEIKLSFNAKEKKIKLCSECAQKIGYFQGKVKKADFLEYLKNVIEDKYPEIKNKLICRICNTTYREFVKTKKLGCPFCYIFLSKIINTETEYIKIQDENIRLKIEDLHSSDEKLSTEKLYIKLKIYMDYEDSEMIKKTVEKIKKYDKV